MYVKISLKALPSAGHSLALQLRLWPSLVDLKREATISNAHGHRLVCLLMPWIVVCLSLTSIWLFMPWIIPVCCLDCDCTQLLWTRSDHWLITSAIVCHCSAYLSRTWTRLSAPNPAIYFLTLQLSALTICPRIITICPACCWLLPLATESVCQTPWWCAYVILYFKAFHTCVFILK